MHRAITALANVRLTCTRFACVLLTAALNQAALIAPVHAADNATMTLMSKPVEVTASFNTGDAGVYFAQISVHNGPIAYLVDTTLHANSRTAAEHVLSAQVRYRAPHLLVRSYCGGGTTWRCESTHVFKVADNSVMRMGMLAGAPDTVLRGNYFQDVYDKLEQQIDGPADGLSHDASPTFVVALMDDNNRLAVNGTLTWQINQSRWRSNAGLLTATEPAKQWSEAQWQDFMSALISNAALARYCERQAELTALLAEFEPKLDLSHRRMLTDALSRVVPAELPAKWRPAQ